MHVPTEASALAAPSVMYIFREALCFVDFSTCPKVLWPHIIIHALKLIIRDLCVSLWSMVLKNSASCWHVGSTHGKHDYGRKLICEECLLDHVFQLVLLRTHCLLFINISCCRAVETYGAPLRTFSTDSSQMSVWALRIIPNFISVKAKGDVVFFTVFQWLWGNQCLVILFHVSLWLDGWQEIQLKWVHYFSQLMYFK